MAEVTQADRHITDRAIEIFIRIALIIILVSLCFDIVRHFIVPGLWSLIIAIGLYPRRFLVPSATPVSEQTHWAG